jgi:hypothetical protein
MKLLAGAILIPAAAVIMPPGTDPIREAAVVLALPIALVACAFLAWGVQDELRDAKNRKS